ncbi:glycosyltransferase [Pleionea sp. CnH1-48]|uniref:glycosyltransferase n=1 Tax=Pleionea sp. CnH1-48 TaxID=2954494 RepID=UPI0020974C4E|nr:glycosyltransferase [Pleionea sp. CnH1-48]MCO7227314.1 glycosyltransferase [Pleionea sp. CnH1-48]
MTNAAKTSLCFVNSTPFWGGGEKLHLDLAQAFARKSNYHISLVTNTTSELANRASKLGFHCEPFSLGKNSFLNPLKMYRLYKYFKQSHIDSVILSDSKDLKASGLCAKLAGVKHIVYLRGQAKPIKSKFLNHWLLKNVCTHFIASSHETLRKSLSRLPNLLPKEKTFVVYHGLDTDEWPTTPAALKESDSAPVLITNIGRLIPDKGQHFLIQAAKILRDEGCNFKIEIVGTGGLETTLQQMIENEELTNYVELVGFNDNIPEYLKSVDIFALSSVSEGFGFVTVEAMLSFKPIVAFNMSSMPELIEHQKTGLLAEHPNVEEFAQYLKQLIQSPELREKLGQAAAQSAREKFSLADRTDELESVIYGE